MWKHVEAFDVRETIVWEIKCKKGRHAKKWRLCAFTRENIEGLSTCACAETKMARNKCWVSHPTSHILWILFFWYEGLTPPSILIYPGQIHKKSIQQLFNPCNIKIHKSVHVMIATDLKPVNVGYPAQVISDNIAASIHLKSKSIVSFRYMEVKCGPQ